LRKIIEREVGVKVNVILSKKKKWEKKCQIDKVVDGDGPEG